MLDDIWSAYVSYLIRRDITGNLLTVELMNISAANGSFLMVETTYKVFSNTRNLSQRKNLWNKCKIQIYIRDKKIYLSLNDINLIKNDMH